MYTGTLIDELIATVERAELHSYELDAVDLEGWYAAAPYELKPVEQNLLGVA